MKKLMNTLLVLSLCATGSSFAATYQNQYGSTLVLDKKPITQVAGEVVGTFNTAVGDCPADMHKPMPLQGYYNGSAFAVAVNFPHCHEVLAITGTIDGQKIDTLDLDTYDHPGAWDKTIIDADHYRQVNS